MSNHLVLASVAYKILPTNELWSSNFIGKKNKRTFLRQNNPQIMLFITINTKLTLIMQIPSIFGQYRWLKGKQSVYEYCPQRNVFCMHNQAPDPGRSWENVWSQEGSEPGPAVRWPILNSFHQHLDEPLLLFSNINKSFVYIREQ